MDGFSDQDIMSLKEVATHLDIPENVLRNWVQWKFREIPCHVQGNGKKSSICFFRPEIDFWFNNNGGRFLSKKVRERKDTARDKTTGHKKWQERHSQASG